MKNIPLLALSIIAPFSCLAPVHAAEKETAPAKPAAKPASEKIDFAKTLDGKLTDADGKPVSAAPLAKAKYTLVYFSAQWCAPCRVFTPQLVKFVAENRKDGNLEVVFLSSDNSKAKMMEYMTEAKMPWGGMLRRTPATAAIEAGVDSIPRVRVYDSEGKLIMESSKIGRAATLAALKEKLK